MLIAIRPNCVCVAKRNWECINHIYRSFHDFRSNSIKFYYKNLTGLITGLVRKVAIICNFYNLCTTLEKFSYIHEIKLTITNIRALMFWQWRKYLTVTSLTIQLNGLKQYFPYILNGKYLNVYYIFNISDLKYFISLLECGCTKMKLY